MARKTVVICTLLVISSLLVAGIVQAQQRGYQFGRPGYANGICPGAANLDLANKVELEGTVESVNMGPGRGFPTFTLVQSDGKKATIVASPFRALVDAGFKIAIGDRMGVLAYPSLKYQDTFIAAELKNLTNGTVITLRDASGVPVAGRGGRCGNCWGAVPGKN